MLAFPISVCYNPTIKIEHHPLKPSELKVRLMVEGTLENPVESGAEGARRAKSRRISQAKGQSRHRFFLCLHFLFSGVADLSAASFFFTPKEKERKKQS